MLRIAEDSDYEIMYENIRDIDRTELLCLCESLEKLFEDTKSLDCNKYSIFADNKLLAICGCNKTVFDGETVGIPFLYSTNFVGDYPKQFCKDTKGILEKYFKKYRTMLNWVHKDNGVAIGWLRWLGFTITDETKGDLVLFYYRGN